MAAIEASPDEGARLFDEVVAGHGLMARGAEAVAASFTRLAAGASVETRTLVLTARWLIDVARHHVSREESLWPLLRESPHRAGARLDVLSEEHEALGEELGTLTRAIGEIAEEREAGGSVSWGLAMKQGTQASHRILDILGDHLAAEEAVLKKLFPAVPDTGAAELRRAVADGVPGPRLPGAPRATSRPGSALRSRTAVGALGQGTADEELSQDSESARRVRLRPCADARPSTGRRFSEWPRRARSSCGHGRPPP